ncbi:uncharacterized protein [Eurosta solidaginis]
MSITFKVTKASENPLNLHFLPVKVNGDGIADVDNYFNPYTREEHCGILSNAVRGFPLKGEILKVPLTHTGYVLQETGEALNSEGSRNLYVSGSFDRFHYWNYDKIPTRADPYKQAIQLLNLSEELYSPVIDADIDVEMERGINKSGAKENGH